ncbi:MAG: MotA/TolQ/ExbB proton channel family protein [Pirellulales bacterium]|nr:MotA/TolQ/ExbB proton channel family protein [Pirellulales bacterium]
MNDSARITSHIGKSPILWGCLVSAGFYGLVHLGVIAHPLIAEYLTGHPIEYATTVMFFVGLAVLVLRLVDLASPWPRAERDGLLLGPIPPGGQPVPTSAALLARLDQVARHAASHPLTTRLREALEWIRRQDSAEGLDGELKYLAERDAERLHESYDLFRVVTWAIPILGFLGTVIGITLAIGKLASGAIEEMIEPTMIALGVAFATTAQALTLVIILMFAKYLVSRAESRRASEVDRRADEELLGRFEFSSAAPDAQLAAIRRLGETVLRATEDLVRRQAELWQESLRAGAQRWNQSIEAAGRHVEEGLAKALAQNLKTHAATLVEYEQAVARRNQEHWDRVQKSLVESAQAALALQKGVNQQTSILQQTVEATGQVARLEETLNRNLAALAGAKHFEQTVMSLAAAIPLLSARLGELPAAPGRVHLDRVREKPHAA